MNPITTFLVLSVLPPAWPPVTSAEAAIAGKFVEAAQSYAGHPVALQLRAMNIIYETTKERGATILMPSSMVDSMNPSVATVSLALASQGLREPEMLRRPAAA